MIPLRLGPAPRTVEPWWVNTAQVRVRSKESATPRPAAIARRTEQRWPHQAQAEEAFEAAFSGLLDESHRDAFEEAMTETAFRFRLTGLDCRLLTVAAIAEVDPAGHLLLGLLSGDGGPGRPTVALALELAGVSANGPLGRSRLSDLSPLVRDGLLRVVGSDVLTTRRLVLPDRVAAHLTHAGGPPPAGLVPYLLDAVPVDVAGVAAVADAVGHHEQLVWVHSTAGAAGVGLAAGACERLGVDYLCVDLTKSPSNCPRQRPRESRSPTPRCPSSSCATSCSRRGFGARSPSSPAAERAAASIRVLLDAPVPVIAVSSSPWDPTWAHAAARWPSPPRGSRSPTESGSGRRCWRRATVPREVTALRMTPEDIARVGRHAVRQAAIAGEPRLGRPAYDAPPGGSANGQRPDTGAAGALTLDDLILPEHAGSEVRRMLDWARYRDELLALAPLQGKGGKGTGICALFAGGPGTGKTLAAHVVADELGIELYAGRPADRRREVHRRDREEPRAGVPRGGVAQRAAVLRRGRRALRLAVGGQGRATTATPTRRCPTCCSGWSTSTGSPSWPPTCAATSTRPSRGGCTSSSPSPTRTRRPASGCGRTTSPSCRAVDPATRSTSTPWRPLDLAGGGIRNVVLSAAYAAIAAGEPVGMRHLARGGVA